VRCSLIRVVAGSGFTDSGVRARPVMRLRPGRDNDVGPGDADDEARPVMPRRADRAKLAPTPYSQAHNRHRQNDGRARARRLAPLAGRRQRSAPGISSSLYSQSCDWSRRLGRRLLADRAPARRGHFLISSCERNIYADVSLVSRAPRSRRPTPAPIPTPRESTAGTWRPRSRHSPASAHALACRAWQRTQGQPAPACA
jgi:hypothetical protein